MKCWYCFITLYYVCVVIVTSTAPSCTTPNGEEASCVSLAFCPVLLNASSSVDPNTEKFVEESACETGKFMVCCGQFGNYTNVPNKTEVSGTNKGLPPTEPKRDFVIRTLLPPKRYCGYQHTDDYFYNASETSVDEFPWMVYIPYTENSLFEIDFVDDSYSLLKLANGVGALITNRYVLTSVIKGSTKQLSGVVRLGQHHLYKETDCIKTSFGEDDCTTPVTEVNIASSFEEETHSIKLLRLEVRISYTDFIRPICLPLQESDQPYTGITISTSGWDEEQSVNGRRVRVKKRIKHTLLDKRECELGNPAPNPICVSPFDNSTSHVCPGDQGGPLMYKIKRNWFIGGIISPMSGCPEYQPIVGERLSGDVIEWILEKMEP